MMPEGHGADALRRVAIERFNLSLGGGLGPLGGKVFRIGHLGDLNEPMVLGTLSTVELAMKVAGVPHTPGRSEEHTSELQSRQYLVCRLLLEKKKRKQRGRLLY